jgi:hypothetical protein
MSKLQGPKGQARSAWKSVPLKNRPAGYGMIGAQLIAHLRPKAFSNIRIQDQTRSFVLKIRHEKVGPK